MFGGRHLWIVHLVAAAGHEVGVERRDECAAATDGLERGPPHEGRHEVVAQEADPDRAHVPDGPAVGLELVLPARASEHDPVVEADRHVLQRLEGQALGGDVVAQPAQV